MFHRMTDYVVSSIDHTVTDYVKVLSDLELITERDRTHTVTFSPEEREEMRAAPREKLAATYADVPLGDGPTIMLNGSGHFHHLTYGMCRGAVDRKGQEYGGYQERALIPCLGKGEHVFVTQAGLRFQFAVDSFTVQFRLCFVRNTEFILELFPGFSNRQTGEVGDFAELTIFDFYHFASSFYIYGV